MTIVKKGAKIAADRLRMLWKLNAALANEGLPFYWRKGERVTDIDLNDEYRPYPPPRYVGTWQPPFYKMTEFYLSYRPGNPEQKDIIYDVEHDALWVYNVGENRES